MTRPALTPRQRQVLDLIEAEYARNTWSPTYREMAEELGRSYPAIFEHVHKLIRKGYIRQQRGCGGRNLIPVDLDPTLEEREACIEIVRQQHEAAERKGQHVAARELKMAWDRMEARTAIP